MFKINTDGSIYVTRGDTCTISVAAKVNGERHLFRAGDVLRIKVYERKACHCVVLQKDFAVLAQTEVVDLVLTERDTRIGELINKPVDYWYEIELNPLTSPQTIVGYDEEGAKAFRLFPEAADNEVIDVPEPEEIPPVDHELDLLSPRPVENQAVTRAILEVKESSQNGIQQNAAAIQQNAEAIQQHSEAVDEHKGNKNNPHGVTKAQLGLSEVDNTSDADKPISTAQAIAMEGIRNRIDQHAQTRTNPHAVTAAQVGLGNVDNTSDMDKPVSEAQAQAIADAKQTGVVAQNCADEAMAAATHTQNFVNDVKAIAENAQNAASEARAVAEEAMAAAENSQNTANSKTAWFAATVTLNSDDWNDNEQTANIPGVTQNADQPVIITPAPDSIADYSFFGIKPETQDVDAVTFSCVTVPDSNITLNVVGFTVPEEEA